MLLFLTTNMAAVTSLANQQYVLNAKYEFMLIILTHYLCRSLSRVVELWEKIVAEAMSG